MSAPQPSHADLAKTLEDMKNELTKLRTEMQPVIDAYKAATWTARVLKWTVGFLASVGAVLAAYFTIRGHN
jgi:cell division protein FtsX